MKKKLTRLFSVLLAAVLVFGTLPVAGAVDDDAAAGSGETVELVLGESKTVWVNADYTSATPNVADSSVAEVSVATGATEASLEAVKELTEGESYLIVNKSSNTLLTGNKSTSTSSHNQKTYLQISGEPTTESTELWKYTDGKLMHGDKYLSIGNGTASVSTSGSTVTMSYNDSGYWTISMKQSSYGYYSSTTYYLCGKTSGNNAYAYGTTSNVKDDTGRWIIYKIIPAQTGGTNITFTGLKVGTTTVTIGEAVYTVTVSEEDLTNVSSKEIQYWITNRVVKANDATSMTISAKSAYGENGVAIKDLVPPSGNVNDKTSIVVDFWKATRLSSDNQQTSEPNEDKTKSGNDFNYIRYYGRSWAYSSDGKSWTNFESDDQVVAYYLQRTKVTDEVTTEVADWGEERSGYSKSNFVLVDYAVKYNSGTRVPDSFPVTNKTIAFHCDISESGGALNKTVFKDTEGYYYRTIGQIKAVNSDDYEVYMITLTPSSDSKGTDTAVGSTASGSSSYKYSGTEKVVWVDKEENLPDEFTAEDKQADDYSVGGEAVVPGLEIYNQHAMLITYYVREKVKESSLTVNYVDESTPETPFYTYNINVADGTTFSEDIALANPWKGNLSNGSVTNIKNKTQWVTADLTNMSSVPASYRHAIYTCTRVVRSGDSKTVTLYYTFSNTAAFVIDFGTSITFSATDISANNSTTEIKSVAVDAKTVSYGEAKVNSDNTITYTPGPEFAASKNGETLQVTMSGRQTFTDEDGNETTKEGDVAYTIHIYPASNVLYEEGFLSNNQDTEDSTNEWELTAATASTQETQKTSDTDKSVFGYDGSYKSSINANGVWKAGSLAVNTPTKPLTTTFYGNTFDLIGTCGYHTGKVIMLIKTAAGAESSKAKIVVVDTRYNYGNGETSATLYQVPLAHVDMGADATYDVKIYASGLAATTAGDDTNSVTAPTALAASADDSYDVDSDEIAAILEENGLTIDQVEVVTTSAMSEIAAADSEQIAVASLPDGDRTAVAHSEGNYVEIDGFRVYRSTTDSVAANYPSTETGATYKNILSEVTGSLTKAYIENGTVESIAVEEYQTAGGPQNEIYIPGGSSVVFTVENVNEVQVSLRAVSGATEWNKAAISSNTEMYYKIEKDEQGNFAIMNTGSELLAIGNVKIPANAGSIVSGDKLSSDAVLKSIQAVYSGKTEEAEVFTPKTFTAKTTATTVIRNKVVTLKVNVSSDVAYITVNGVKYTRTGLTGLFRNTRTIRVVNTVKKDQTKTYEIVAYNADGVASETVTVTG